jgi:hypothetical protein
MRSNTPKRTISVPEAGEEYYGLSRQGSYEAARRGDIPTIRIGRLLRVPVAAMERKLEEAGNWQRVGVIAQRVVESCGADIRDHNIKMQRELNRQKGKGDGTLGSRGGTTHGMSKTKVFAVWKAMVLRCTNPRDANYHNYGGRGIYVCPDWMKFENFYRDMGEPNGLTLDRIDNDGPYCKDNCRWVTQAQQNANKRPWNINRQYKNAD